LITDQELTMRSKQKVQTRVGRVLPVLAGAMLMLYGSTGLAAAQDSTPRRDPAQQSETTAQADSPSPELSCWHRTGRVQVQPTLCDLPPAVARREGKPTPQQEAFDKKLDICRGC
jgi:hypothetical protein